MKTKVRFHLAKGPNYQRWQVRKGDREPVYYDPEDVILEMYNAVLRNQRKTAERIYDGQNKTVCAWVECDHLVVKRRHQHAIPDTAGFCHFNPRRRPHWFDKRENDLDNQSYSMLATFGRLIFIPENNDRTLQDHPSQAATTQD